MNSPDESFLKRESAKTLYFQMAESIARQIREGRYPPFARLPSEKELMARYGVSRITVRQAIAVLLKKGLIETKQGKGTFVVGTILQHGLDRLVGFYDSLVAQGEKPTTQLLDFGRAASADRAGTAFEKSRGVPFQLKRLYLLRGRPFAVVRGLITADAGEITREQAEQMTIYRLLGELLHLEVARADVRVRASVVGKRYSETLKLSPGRPMLVMERVSSDIAGRPLEHSFFHVVPELYEVSLGVAGPLDISKGIRRVKSGDALTERTVTVEQS